MVKKKKEDKILRDLFKDGLEGMGIDPSPSFGPALMKSVRRGEFFSFIPSKFNVWYAGLIAVTVAVTTLVLTVGGNGEADLPGQPVNESIAVTPTDSLYIDSATIGITPPKADDLPAEKLLPESASLPETTEEKNPEPAPPPATKGDEENGNVTPVQKVDTAPSVATQMLQIELATTEMPSIRNAAEPLFTASTYKGCLPLSVSFTVADGEGDSYRWSFGDGGYSSEKDPEWLFDEEGEYEVTLKVFQGDEVTASFSSSITVYPKPVARFEIMPEEAIIPDDMITFLNYSTGAMAYHWSFGDGRGSELFEPTHLYDRYGNYDVTLVALSEFGCSDSLTLYNAFTESSYSIEFPNAFIPNQSGESGGYYTNSPSEADKVFYPVYNGVASYQMRIYNRQGMLLFESNDLSIGWDGYYRSHICDPGVYIWKVRGTFINGEPFTRMGDVTLINMAE
jgi:PKD repeat protein